MKQEEKKAIFSYTLSLSKGEGKGEGSPKYLLNDMSKFLVDSS